MDQKSSSQSSGSPPVRRRRNEEPETSTSTENPPIVFLDDPAVFSDQEYVPSAPTEFAPNVAPETAQTLTDVVGQWFNNSFGAPRSFLRYLGNPTSNEPALPASSNQVTQRRRIRNVPPLPNLRKNTVIERSAGLTLQRSLPLAGPSQSQLPYYLLRNRQDNTPSPVFIPMNSQLAQRSPPIDPRNHGTGIPQYLPRRRSHSDPRVITLSSSDSEMEAEDPTSEEAEQNEDATIVINERFRQAANRAVLRRPRRQPLSYANRVRAPYAHRGNMWPPLVPLIGSRRNDPALAVSADVAKSFGPNGLLEDQDSEITEIEETIFQKVLRKKLVCDVCLTHLKLYRCRKCMYSMCQQCTDKITAEYDENPLCPHCREEQHRFVPFQLPRF